MQRGFETLRFCRMCTAYSIQHLSSTWCHYAGVYFFSLCLACERCASLGCVAGQSRPRALSRRPVALRSCPPSAISSTVPGQQATNHRYAVLILAYCGSVVVHHCQLGWARTKRGVHRRGLFSSSLIGKPSRCLLVMIRHRTEVVSRL